MGEISGFGDEDSIENPIKNDGENFIDKKEEEILTTDVEGVNADSFVQKGKDQFPCFDVDKHAFYQNMNSGRRRIRFKNGSNAQQYMSKSKYQRKFYIKYTDGNGDSMMRPIAK